LAPQAQQLVDAMAIHWDPLTAADLTELLGPLSVNHVSAQLKRLEDFGVVEKTPWYGEKKNAFQIAERFFNIWYLMRASRRVRRGLLWLVKFLEAWFDREELDARARAFLDRDPHAMGQERYAEMAMAYSQAVPDRHLRRSLESAQSREKWYVVGGAALAPAAGAASVFIRAATLSVSIALRCSSGRAARKEETISSTTPEGDFWSSVARASRTIFVSGWTVSAKYAFMIHILSLR
jgi:hypothetical protein